jgi:RNA polymerase sigma-70 factor (ECF subfamily)
MLDDLVERARRGDEDAFASLAAASVDRCYALAYRILRDNYRAEDATQQALLGAWRDMSQLKDTGRFQAWLYRLVVNACYAESRRDRRWNGQIRLVATDRTTSPDPSIGIADRDELERGFRQLSTEQRAVLVLHHYAGFPLTEVAAMLDIPIGTARSRHHYAIRQLRAFLEADARLTNGKDRTA